MSLVDFETNEFGPAWDSALMKIEPDATDFTPELFTGVSDALVNAFANHSPPPWESEQNHE